MFIFLQRLVFEVFILELFLSCGPFHFPTKALHGHFLWFNLYLCTEIRNVNTVSVIVQFIKVFSSK